MVLRLLQDWSYLSAREAEQLDAEYLLFRTGLVVSRNHHPDTFLLSELLPGILLPQTKVCSPTYGGPLTTLRYAPTRLGTGFEAEMRRLLNHGRHFFLGFGTESFTDSWAVFTLLGSEKLVFICVQSKRRITSSNLTYEDVQQQVKYCTEHLAGSIWYLIIVTGDSLAGTKLGDNVFIVTGRLWYCGELVINFYCFIVLLFYCFIFFIKNVFNFIFWIGTEMLTYYGPVLGQLRTTAIENERHAGQPSPIFLPGVKLEQGDESMIIDIEN